VSLLAPRSCRGCPLAGEWCENALSGAEGERKYSPAEVGVRGGGARKSRSHPHLHVNRGTLKPELSHGLPPIHPPHQGFRSQVGKPVGSGHALVHLLQLLPDSDGPVSIATVQIAVTILMLLGGGYMLMAAFTSKPFTYGFTKARMTPSATAVSRVLRFAVGILFLAIACRFIFEML